MEASWTEISYGLKNKFCRLPCFRRMSLHAAFFPWVPTSIVPTSLGVRHRETHTECVDTVMLAGREATQF